jgi:FtsP/CotA-like multicopper oxidase with cupredoxin domain
LQPRIRPGSGFILFTGVLLSACRMTPASHGAAPLAAMNDNRRPAGTLSSGVLTLDLDVRQGRWQPEGPNGIMLTVPVFAEHGKSPEVPGPLVRVPAGTRVKMHLHNALEKETVTVHGLHDRPGHTDQTIALAPNADRDVAFDAGPAGTYFYWATTTATFAIDDRAGDGMLSGAFIVDAPGSVVEDRVFVIDEWVDEPKTQTPSTKSHEAYLINGRSWPATERLTYPAGAPIHWRIVNTSIETHPLHLHGTYFSVDAAGDEGTMDPSTTPPPSVATRPVDPGRTMAMTWTPREPGNWVFHCHVLFHIDPQLRLTPAPSASDPHAEHADHGGGAELHMAGLTLAVAVTSPPDRVVTPEPSNPRRLTLEVGRRANGVTYPSPDDPKVRWPGLGYRLAGNTIPAPFVSPGPPIVLTRGEPVAISVVNHLDQTTTVHWHGIELRSYYDGVSGIGGSGDRRTPAIAPGQTFVAEFTPPRAGTFMYHTHLNDYQQLSTGLYGVIVVLEPGERFDPETDKVFVLGRGPDDDKDPVLINGREWPGGVDLKTGKTYRLRFAGITPAPSVTMSIRSGETLQSWQPIAKDGKALAGAAVVPATQKIFPGETFDFAFTPAASGPLRLVGAMTRQHTELALNVK